jgi:hypothetical protein
VTSEPLGADAAAPVPGRVIDDFTDAENWKRYDVEGGVHPLAFAAEDGAMHLTSDSSAGLLWRAITLDPATEPLLAWRWRVSRVFENSSPLSPELDNFPARLLIGFDSGWHDAGPAAKAWRSKVEKVTGMTPPARAICYTFGGSAPATEAVDAAFGEGRIVVINLRGHNAEAGRWYHEVRDFAADYRAIFNQPAPAVMAIGLGCDSHRRATRAEAWFADLTVYGPDARQQFRLQLGEAPRRSTPPLVWLIIAAASTVAACSAGGWLWLRRKDRLRAGDSADSRVQ